MIARLPEHCRSRDGRTPFRVLSQVAEGLAVVGVVAAEQHGRGTELVDDVRPHAVLACPLADRTLQGCVFVGVQYAVGLEPAAAVRELGIHRGNAVLVIALRDQIAEHARDAGAGPGAALFPDALLLGQSLGLALREQQVVHQHAQGQLRLPSKHAGTSQGEIQLIDEIRTYLIGGCKRSGSRHPTVSRRCRRIAVMGRRPAILRLSRIQVRRPLPVLRCGNRLLSRGKVPFEPLSSRYGAFRFPEPTEDGHRGLLLPSRHRRRPPDSSPAAITLG